jgi:hypothetical protein
VTAAGASPAPVSARARLAVRLPARSEGRTAAWWPWSILAAAVGWNLASLRALTLGVAYLNDSSVHEQMVRFATAQLRAGHLPFTSWFPFLGEGSPQFLHYQSLPAIVTGLVGLAAGPDVDEVGYTLRTASLMTDPEFSFDDRNPGDYRLFAIHYLIIATGSRPPVPAALELRAGPYSLWRLPGAAGVLRAGTIVGQLAADRTDIGTRTLRVLHSDLAQHDRYEQVRFDQPGSGVPARFPRSWTVPPPRGPAGTVVAQADELAAGRRDRRDAPARRRRAERLV